MSVRVAINGFGRVGRAAFPPARENGADVEWVSVSDVVDEAQVEVVARYDDEWGYATRLVEPAQRVLVPVPAIS